MPSSPRALLVILGTLLALPYSIVLGCAPHSPKPHPKPHPKDPYADLLEPGTGCTPPPIGNPPPQTDPTCSPTKCEKPFFNADSTKIMCMDGYKVYFKFGNIGQEDEAGDSLYCTKKKDWAGSPSRTIVTNENLKTIFCRPNSNQL